MRFLNSRKIAWGICIVGCLAAVISLLFLPDLIPMHFSNGVADDFSGKIQIFLFPVLEVFIAWLTGREKVKYSDTFQGVLVGCAVQLDDQWCFGVRSFHGILGDLYGTAVKR